MFKEKKESKFFIFIFLLWLSTVPSERCSYHISLASGVLSKALILGRCLGWTRATAQELSALDTNGEKFGLFNQRSYTHILAVCSALWANYSHLYHHRGLETGLICYIRIPYPTSLFSDPQTGLLRVGSLWQITFFFKSFFFFKKK